MPSATPGLHRLIHAVADVATADRTSFTGGRLAVNPLELAALAADPALDSVTCSWASPGTSSRIVKVLDAVEPRTKAPGGGGIFPGLLGPPRPQGGGETHVLRGCAVVTAGHLPRAQEALVDMSGPAAPLSFLASTHNLVVEFVPASGAPWEDVDAALRRAALRIAVHLAEAAVGAQPDAVEVVPPLSAALGDGPPRIGLITNLQTQGAFKDVFVYGSSFGGSLPTALDPTELDDGAVVSGQYGHPGLKNPTYLHQNHPLVAALRELDGSELRFSALVISPEPVDQARKELVCQHAARLCRSLGCQAVIVTKEGGGNADSDMSLKMDALEELGMAAVGLFAEMSGADGTGAPVVSPPDRATAMVSTGNYDERLELPAVERALGGERLDVASAGACDAVEVPTAVVYGSLNPLGRGRLTAAAETAVEVAA